MAFGRERSTTAVSVLLMTLAMDLHSALTYKYPQEVYTYMYTTYITTVHIHASDYFSSVTVKLVFTIFLQITKRGSTTYNRTT